MQQKWQQIYIIINIDNFIEFPSLNLGIILTKNHIFRKFPLLLEGREEHSSRVIRLHPIKNFDNIWICVVFERILAKLLMIVCYYHDMYAFQSKSTIYSCLNVKELRRDTWTLSDSNRIRIHNHLVHKWTLNQLAKLVECSFANWVVVGSKGVAKTSDVRIK